MPVKMKVGGALPCLELHRLVIEVVDGDPGDERVLPGNAGLPMEPKPNILEYSLDGRPRNGKGCGPGRM
jgi:hypothetical protein